MKNKKLAVLKSVISLLLCVSMLAGTTFAWFTDGVRSGRNTIVAGNLDVELEYLTADGTWLPVQEDTNVFEENTLWEPGHTEVVYLRVSNAGTLALKYQLGVNIAAESGSVNVKGEEFVLSDYIEFAAIEDVQTAFASRDAARAAVQSAQILSTGYTQEGELLAGDPADYVAFVVYMPETVGNEANYRTGELPPRIELGISLFATQFTHEADSFGDNYDYAAGFPDGDISLSGKTDITTENGMTSAAATITAGAATADVPAGVQVNDGATALELSVNKLSATGSNITAATNEDLLPVDVHVEGVSATNTTPVKVRLAGLAPIGLNMGNLKLYHVENGTTNPMTRVATEAELTAHNQFFYDPATGDVILSMATFSEVAMIADTINPWKGEFNYEWYNADDEVLTIANADQLAGFGAIVGGMVGQSRDSFGGKTVKLISNINLGDGESKNNPDIIFYPIGYNSSDNTYKRTNTGITSSLKTFEGVFDGQGHTIANFYQNTWEMKGDHDWYSPEEQYYRDGMGLFGRVYGGTVKNLTVENFKSDGEIATTGVIAAYADGATFENIAIFNCNPRVYNIGNGGIVGCVGWYAKDANLKTTFKNITVDNSNKISALWGSYDVACGGIVGQYYPTSGQSSAGSPKNAGVHFENCHVSAQMDVYNDVCGNYQYYAYRYAGMIIGSIRENTTNDDGKTIPNMTGITAENCTVNYGTWNDYYYCEFVKNGHPSYAGDNDYKFSRMEHSDYTFEDSNGNGIIDTDEERETMKCNHDHSDVEDQRAIYLPFYQLFTGYGWGVSSIGLEKYNGVTINGFNLDIEEGGQQESVEKFEVKGQLPQITVGVPIKVGDLFGVKSDVTINPDAIQVSVSALGDSKITANYEANKEKWEEGTLTFTTIEGMCSVTIQDYHFCKPTSILFKNGVFVKEVEKFDVAFPNVNDYLYRVGNQNEISLGSLFDETGEAFVDDKSVAIKVTDSKGKELDVNFTRNDSDWEQGKLEFSNDFTGLVKIVISENDSYEKVLNLEVVDAKNITTATSAMDGMSVVLLNDVKVSTNGTLHYKNCTVYGNGFTIDVRGGMNEYNSKQGHGIIMTENATLDNLVIVGDVYNSYGAYTNQEDYTSAIDATNTVIQNCHISNCSAPVRANGITIKNSTLYGGTVANLIISGGVITLEDVITVNYNDGRGVLGFGIVISDGANESVKLILNGELTQYNYISENDISAVQDSNAQKLFEAMFDSKYEEYHFVKDGNKYVIPGVLAMVNTFDETDIDDETNNGYTGTQVSYKTINGTFNGYLYTLPASADNGVNNDYNNEVNAEQGAYLPTLEFSLGDQGLAKDGEEDTRYLIGDRNGIEALYLNTEEPISLDLTRLATATKHNNKLAVSVSYKTADGGILGTDTTVQLTESGTLVFTVTDNIFYDANGDEIDKNVDVIFEVPVTVSVKEASIKNAEITVNKTKINGDYNSSKYMTFNPLEAITITDYDASGTGTTVALNKNISTKTVEYINTSSGAWGGATITITYTDGRVLTVHLGTSTLNSPGSSNGGKTITIQSDGSIKTDGKVANSSATGGTWTINGYSFKGNNGSTVTNNTKVTVNFADESGCVTSDTLVMLADGTQKRIDQVTLDDQLLVWNFFTGDYDVVPAAIIFYHGDDTYRVLKLHFSDGTSVKVINNHGFFDVKENKFVFIDENNVESYLGHYYVKVNGDTTKSVKLVGYDVVEEYTGCYSIQTAVHINFMVEGMFSLTIPPIEGWFDYFELGSDMKYDEAKMQADIEKYGLYDYSVFADYVTYEQFIAFNGPYLKVLVGRGVLTFEQIFELIATYVTQ